MSAVIRRRSRAGTFLKNALRLRNQHFTSSTPEPPKELPNVVINNVEVTDDQFFDDFFEDEE